MKFSVPFREVFALALMALALPAATAQSGVTAAPLQAGAAVRLDRLLADPAWQGAPRFDAFVERMPVSGAAPAQRTTVQVLAGDRALYVAVRAEDRAPDAIRARLGPHDSVGREQDSVIVMLDPVGSRKSAQFFSVNPLGSTADGMYTSDTDSEDLAPDFEFEARAAADATGWTAVLRIPYASLRFAAQGQGTWRLLVRRMVPRDVAYEYTSVLIPASGHDTIATMPPLEGVPPPRSAAFLKLTPSVSVHRAVERDDGGVMRRETSASPSLDIKWRPMEEVIVDATLRPDFSQVDLDVPQLRGNTRFALYFDEKRPFFQESSDLWRTPTTQLYTRAVTRPDWGLRATRRNDRFAGTLFVARDEGGGAVLLPGPWGTGSAEQPAGRVLATRLRWDAPGTHWALMGLDRRYDGGAGANSVLGTDFSVPAGAPGLKLRGQWLGSATTALADAGGRLRESPARHGHSLWLGLTQRAEAVESSLTVKQTSAGYRNDMGFLTQAGVRTLVADANRVWRNLGPLAELWLYAQGEAHESLADGIAVQRFLRPGVYLAHQNGLTMTAELRVLERQRVHAGGVAHAERYLHLESKAQPSPWIPRVAITFDAGRMIDFVADTAGPAHRLALDVDLLPTQRSSLALSLQHQTDGLWQRRSYAEGNVQLKAGYGLAAGQDLRLIAVRRQLTRLAPAGAQAQERGHTLSLSYRWTWSRYRAFYAGVTRDRVSANGLTRATQEAYMKLTHSLDILP